MSTKTTNFINKIAPKAVADMKVSGVLASLTIAQAILESGWGESVLAVKANNLFGIKCGSNWKGKAYDTKTKEHLNGSVKVVSAAFRAYDNWDESIKDHSDLLQASRYAKVLEAKTYQDACREVYLAGYATNENYPEQLVSLIEKYDLMQYDGEMNQMAQRLILPINKCRVTAGYKNANYKKQFGYTHYGADYTDVNKKDRTIWGSGNGEVTHAGWSDSGGNVICIVYKDCLLKNGKTSNITVRYYHLDKIYVKVGDKITKDTKLGLYGNTGSSSGAHLHVECDTDIKYPNYTPQIAKNSGVLKSGTDSTLNPAVVFFAKTSSPDYQEVSNSGYDTVASSDLAIEKIK